MSLVAEVVKEQAEVIVKTLDERTQEAAIELIDRLNKGRLDWAQNTAIVGVYEDPKRRPYFSGTQVCHAGLDDLVGSKRVVNVLMNGEGYATGRVLDKEVELWFVDYILNRSPYAEGFITKDAKQALEQRYTISTGDVPSNLMAAGMVALRRLWEYPYVAKAAYDLAKAGVNEDLAFLLGHLIASNNNPGPDSSASWTGFAAGHCSINPSKMDWLAVKNFLAHKVVNANGLFSKGAGYHGYDLMYTKQNIYDGSYYNYVHAEFPYDRCKGKAIVDLNPFRKAVPVGINQVPYAKAIEVMAEWANTTLMEKINNA